MGRITYATIGMVEGIPQSSSLTWAITVVPDLSSDAAGASVENNTRTNATAPNNRLTNCHRSAYNAPTSNLVHRFARERLPTSIDELPIGCDRVDPPEFGPTHQCTIEALLRDRLMYRWCGLTVGWCAQSSKQTMQFRRTSKIIRRKRKRLRSRHGPREWSRNQGLEGFESAFCGNGIESVLPHLAQDHCVGR